MFPYHPIEADEGEVRVELRVGESRLPSWRFFASEAEQRVMVGSSHDCDWQVQANGVAPYHAELLWAGDVLWIAPVGGQEGNIWINAAPVVEWTQIEQDSEVCFGEARFGVGGITDLFAPTVISSVEELSQSQVSNPQIVSAPQRASGFEEVEPVTGRVRVKAPAPDKTAMTDLSDLERWRDSCVGEKRAGAPAAAAPSAPPPANRVQAPPMANVKRAPSPVVIEPSAPAPRPEPPVNAPVGKRFAAPPPVAHQPSGQADEGTRSFGEVARDLLERVTDTIPTRAAIAALGVIFIVSLLLLHDFVGAKNEGKPKAAAPSTRGPSVTKITTEPSPVVEAEAEPLDPAERVAEEGRAARFVAAGRLVEALPVYERLVASDPGNDAFAITIRVIRHQLAAKCKAAGGAGDDACLEAR